METNFKKEIGRSFWMGYIVAFSTVLFIQGWHGLEGYIEYIQKNWVDIHWSVWVVTWVGAFWYYSKIHATAAKKLTWLKLKGGNNE